MDHTPEKNLDQWAEQGGPPRLRAGLTSIFGSTPAIGRSLDEQFLNAVRQESIRRNRMRWVIRYAIGSVAAAAAVVLIVIRTTHHDQPAINNPTASVATTEDVNRDGKLDILDAFLMARKVAANEHLTKEWDFNHDGTVDAKDVDVVAFAAVKLKGGETP
ncbi:MAG TPA: dockerin type I repeat-containing protein [Tepidisphaeraceae bacterium]|nr:dockerin type I repeat-containing protein [Tepidisphaeraceae bacterium]